MAIVGGVLLGVSLFLGWFTLGNAYAYVRSCGPHDAGASCSGWTALGPAGILLAAIALVPLILAWVVIRGSRLSWPRGELTAVIALLALTLIVFYGIIDRPGFPSGEVNLALGWFVALLGGVLIFLGAITRSQESAHRRKPPGIL